MQTIFRVKFGSHLYGTNTPESDTDYKAVHLPDARDILLQRVPESINTGPRKTKEGEKNLPDAVDEESYSLQRYLQLLVGGQTVAIDMLFAPMSRLEMTSSLWEDIYENRSRLLTKKSAAFVGYCRTQANKYGIKGSRVASARNASAFFSGYVRTDGAPLLVEDLEHGLPILFDDHTRVVTKETTPGRFETYFECCNRLVGFKNKVSEAAAIFTRIYENYGARAKLAETNEGIDWKALSHAVRVGEEALELLNTGNITFPLANAKHILEIKKGLLPYADVAEEIEGLLVAVESASASSNLRDTADLEWVDNFVSDAYMGVIHG